MQIGFRDAASSAASWRTPLNTRPCFARREYARTCRGFCLGGILYTKFYPTTFYYTSMWTYCCNISCVNIRNWGLLNANHDFIILIHCTSSVWHHEVKSGRIIFGVTQCFTFAPAGIWFTCNFKLKICWNLGGQGGLRGRFSLFYSFW